MTILSRLVGHPLWTRSPVSSKLWHQTTRTLKLKKNRPPPKEEAVKFENEVGFKSPHIHRMGRNFVKCSIFAGTFCAGTFVATSIWQYENVRQSQKNLLQHWTKMKWNTLGGFESKQGEWRQSINKWWNELCDGHKVYWPIFFLNGVVFSMWQIPFLKTTMFRYFAFSPAGYVVCLPMLLSVFSHCNLFHFAANMYVLHSFSAPVCNQLGKEQFLCLYLTSGVLSSLAGAAFKILIRSPGPSLGASGAIMGILGYFCSVNRDAKLGIIFIPNFNFSAEQGLTALLCMDTIGVILRWRLFDHAAHLGGALSGMAYARWGSDLWSGNIQIIKQWHQLRNDIEAIKKERRD